jgi:RNA ligase
VFPTITHISDVLPAIEGRDEFTVGRRDGYTFIDYNYAGSDTFDDPMRRECRGLKFDLSGKLIARPFHKFFNLHEKPHEVPEFGPHAVVMEKLDGSMVHPAFINGEIAFMTRAGITDQAKMALEFVYGWDLGDKVIDLCESFLDAGKTPIFEFTSPLNQIVVKYDEPKLTLLAIRDNKTGNYHSPEALRIAAEVAGIPHVRFYDQSLTDMVAFLAHAKALKDMEGYVLRVGQQLIKVKADDYVLRHRAKASLLWEKDVLKLVLEGKVDDVIGMLSPEEGTRLQAWADTVNSRLSVLAAVMKGLTDKHHSTDRREFASRILDAFETDAAYARSLCFQIYDGRDPVEVVRSHALKQTSSGSKASYFLKHVQVPPWTPVRIDIDA